MNVLACIVLVFLLAEGSECKKCTCKEVNNMLDKLEAKLEARIAILEEPITVECTESHYLISGPDPVPDEALTASTSWDTKRHSPKFSRLNTVEKKGVWAARKLDKKQWIQARFEYPMTVKGIAIRGRNSPRYKQYVTEFTVSYSADCHSQYRDVVGSDRKAMKFKGNVDINSVVTRLFPKAVTALCVRLHPTQWKRHISLRWDIIGC